MSTPETPRTWKLRAITRNRIPGWIVLVTPEAANPPEDVEVVEKAPIDVERERLLDLVERLTANLAAVESQRSGCQPSEAVIEANAYLREYGRLGKEES